MAAESVIDVCKEKTNTGYGCRLKKTRLNLALTVVVPPPVADCDYVDAASHCAHRGDARARDVPSRGTDRAIDAARPAPRAPSVRHGPPSGRHHVRCGPSPCARVPWSATANDPCCDDAPCGAARAISTVPCGAFRHPRDRGYDV